MSVNRICITVAVNFKLTELVHTAPIKFNTTLHHQ